MQTEEFKQKRFILIAGQPKSGTTSLYSWLRQHPQICASTLKETRFFLDPDYPLDRPFGHDGGNLEMYTSFFSDMNKQVMVEATPDYMYSPAFLDAAKELTKSIAVIITRDPQARLLSAYRFYKQRGLIETTQSFDEWIAFQHQAGCAQNTPVHLRALDHCNLSKYLPPLRAAFGPRLVEIDFSDLKSDPLGVVNFLLSMVDIEAMDEASLETKQENVTKVSRWPLATRIYNRTHRKVSQSLIGASWLRATLRPIGKAARYALNSKSKPIEIIPSAATLEIIRSYAEKQEPASR